LLELQDHDNLLVVGFAMVVVGNTKTTVLVLVPLTVVEVARPFVLTLVDIVATVV